MYDACNFRCTKVVMTRERGGGVVHVTSISSQRAVNNMSVLQLAGSLTARWLAISLFWQLAILPSRSQAGQADRPFVPSNLTLRHAPRARSGLADRVPVSSAQSRRPPPTFLPSPASQPLKPCTRTAEATPTLHLFSATARLRTPLPSLRCFVASCSSSNCAADYGGDSDHCHVVGSPLTPSSERHYALCTMH